MAAKASKSKIRHYLQRLKDRVPPPARKWIVGIIGGLLLLIGVAMVILPGPAVVVIPIALALLASEFSWARRCWNYCRRGFVRVRKAWRRHRPAWAAR
jgi:hypothetical protein